MGEAFGLLSGPTYLLGAVGAVAVLSLLAARSPIFQKDLRRAISLGVGMLGLLTIVLSLHVLVTGQRLRDAAMQAADSAVAQWNGLILSALVLLMVSSLTFFFAIGAFIWSVIPEPANPASGAKAYGGIDSKSQILNRVDRR